MKKLFKSSILICVLLVGYLRTEATEQELTCFTDTVTCPNGGGGYGMVCGSTPEEIWAAMEELEDVICNQ